MSGKSYTMREMKIIVDYLVETKAYGDTKGRKMWMDFASSKLTDRTWQSLKETFLKRILPDIHNPYYKLTVEQINSFRAGYDVKYKNKLEIEEVQTISDESNNSNDNKRSDKKSKLNSNEDGKTAGENINSTNKPSRSRSGSVDTVIVEKCYETSENILKDSETPNVNKENENNPTTKSFRDCITYSEPLTPMLQEVLHDFASDPESDLEGQMQIDENAPENDNTENIEPIVKPEDGTKQDVAMHGTHNSNKVEKEVLPKNTEENIVEPTPKSKELSKDSASITNPVTKINDTFESLTTTGNNTDNTEGQFSKNPENSNVFIESQNVTTTESKDLIITSGTTDASLPNNPEALNIQNHSTLGDTNEIANNKPEKMSTRKRTSPQDKLSSENKKIKLDKDKIQISDKKKETKTTDIHKESNDDSHKNIEINTNKDSVTNISKIANSHNESDTLVTIIASSTESNVSQEPASNPCLKNVSLFDEQFSQETYITSDSSDAEKSKNKGKQQSNTEVKEKSTKVKQKAVSEVKHVNAEINTLTQNVVNEQINTKDQKHANTTDKQLIDKVEKNKELKVSHSPDVVVLRSNSDSDMEVTREIINTVVQINTTSPQKTKTGKQLTDNLQKSEESKGLHTQDVVALTSHSNLETEKTKEQINSKVQEQINTGVKQQTDNLQKNEVSKASHSQDMVLLRSHSDSDTEKIPPRSPLLPKQVQSRTSSKSDRHRNEALATMLGFSSGAVGSRRRQHLSQRRRKISQNNAQSKDSNLSQWSSDSDSEEYVLPPRGRKNRNPKKVLKPQSSNVLSLEEEGGLFVMCGKKIYPLVKDGKIVKNYLTYVPGSESEEEEFYWRLKYEQEKKKTNEYKKLLENARGPRSGRCSPVLQSNPIRAASSHKQTTESVSRNDIEIREDKKEAAISNPPPPPEKIKIKFTKNNEEVHLEGHWPQIHPVLEQVVQIFHKEVDHTSSTKSNPIVEVPSSKEPSSGLTTPVTITALDPEVHEKVDKIEDEIFKEIEERDKEEREPTGIPVEQASIVTKREVGKRENTAKTRSPVKILNEVHEKEDEIIKKNEERDKEEQEPPEIPVEEVSNVNKRRGGRQQRSLSGNRSPAKRSKISSPRKSKAVIETSPSIPENTNSTRVSTRKTRSPVKILSEPANLNETKIIQTRKSKGRMEDDDDDEVRYMFPPQTRRGSKTPADKKTKKEIPKRSSPTSLIFSSPDNLSLNSMESTQGYQDSDISPLKLKGRKKKRMSLSTVFNRGSRRSCRNRVHPYIHCDASNDSSNSFPGPSVMVPENTSLDSEVYRSDSYQLLMPKMKHSVIQLERIDETSPITNEFKFPNTSGKNNDKNEILSIQIDNYDNLNSGPLTSDMGSSSMSLPLSPELSIVENLSLSRDMNLGSEYYPTINETQATEENNTITCNKYVISQVDVTMPLMEQECQLESCYPVITDNTAPNPKVVLTESLLTKIGTINIKDQPTLTDSLDIKLQELLLESAKKISSAFADKESNMMEVDANAQDEKNTKAKKRCSTPRKRKGSKKAQVPKVAPVVEEEHVVSLAKGGRKSCPPVMENVACDENTLDDFLDIANLSIDASDKPKGKRKKDIIKVKIVRPKNNKKTRKCLSSMFAPSESKVSICNDSGINDTVSSIFPAVDVTVDLIHNHSETCLQTSVRSPITLDEFMDDNENMWTSQIQHDKAKDSPPELYCNNARDVQYSYTASNSNNIESPGVTVLHSPVSLDNCSLITEDLSDDNPTSQPQVRLLKTSKWHLLSEEDTSNINVVYEGTSNTPSFGANLNQIFPITCAVPDLSTITEMSRENGDNSRKPTLELDGLSGEDFNSQSIF